MSCFKPLTAYRGSGNVIVFDKNKSRSRVPFQLPCGRCIGCRMEKARQWGIRCLHEKKMWRDNCYVTLTYQDKFLPPGGSLSLRDVQLFMKRLRKWRNSSKEDPVRFFLGGEYGEENKRPHYHALLFNVGFPDLRRIGANKRGESLYTSETLSGLWSVDGEPLGHVSVGEVTFDSAVYCAKYSMKKVTGDAAASHYEVYDQYGEVHVRRPEFAVMSRRPGIGAGYYAKYGEEIRNLDSVVVAGREVRPPRFYDSRTLSLMGEDHGEDAVLCLCAYCCNKRKRKRMAVLNRADNTEERLRVKEKLALIAAEKKERKL